MSSIVNKVKEALHSDKDKSTTHEQPTGTHGPHSSRTANAADPRIDSDRDHRANPTTNYGEGAHARPHEGVGSTGLGSSGLPGNVHDSHNTHGTSGLSSTGGYGHEQPTGTSGPHSSRAANAVDPRVDSDNDHRGAGNYGSSTTHGTHTGTHTGAHTGGLGSTGGAYGHEQPTGTSGPHSSRAANAVDPRVDSDNDHRGAGNYGSSTTHGTHGTHGTTGGLGSTGNTYGSSNTYGSGASEGTHGPHGSRVANAADPRVDSDRDHRGAPGSNFNGPASNTAGPHKSDALNKVDPRVDSDLDGSKTYGGNKTHQY